MKLLGIDTITRHTGLHTCVSSSMEQSIALWNDIFTGKASWNKKYPSCGIIPCISGMLSTAVGEEIETQTENEALQNVLKNLNENNYKLIQYMVSVGGAVVRPVFVNNKIQYELLPLGNYLPVRYDFDGTLTHAILTKHIQGDKTEYLLVEQHAYENRTHSVVTDLYEIQGGMLKKKNLSDCKATENLTPRYEWKNVDMPFIVEFRNRVINRIDGSLVPVSMIAGNENLIEDADKQYYRMNWEQEGGELKVFADEDLFQKRQGRNGESEHVTFDPTLKKLFVKLSGDTTEGGKKIYTHAPSLRTDQQVALFQQILRRIELAMSVGKGTLSDMESVQQTATQFAGGKKAFYSIVDTLESELEDKYRYCAYVFAYIASAFLNVPFDDELQVVFNDMTRKDPMQMKQTAMQEVAAGILSEWEYRMMFYGETEEEAKARTPEKPIAEPMW